MMVSLFLDFLTSLRKEKVRRTFHMLVGDEFMTCVWRKEQSILIELGKLCEWILMFSLP